jgi:hypothetical protein
VSMSMMINASVLHQKSFDTQSIMLIP